MAATEPESRATPRPIRLGLAVALVAAAVLWGGYETVRGGPSARSEPRAMAWLERYTALREPLAGARDVIYVNAPEVKGKFRFFRAQYVLTPATLHLRDDLDRLLSGPWPKRPVILDYRKERELKPDLARLRERLSRIGADVEIETLGRGLAVVVPRNR